MKNNYTYTPLAEVKKIENLIKFSEGLLKEIFSTLQASGIEATFEKVAETLTTKGEFVRAERLKEAEAYAKKAPDFLKAKVIEEAKKSIDEDLILALKGLAEQWPENISLEDFSEDKNLKEEKKEALRKEAIVTLSEADTEEVEKLLSFLQEYQRIDKLYSVRRLVGMWQYSANPNKDLIADEVRATKKARELRRELLMQSKK